MPDRLETIRTLTLPPGDVMHFDASSYLALREFNCSMRNCERLNLEKNRCLEILDCSVNNLSSLDLSFCEKLYSLDCSFNALSKLVLPKGTDLEIIDCSHNFFKKLDLGGARNIREIYCDANPDLIDLVLPHIDKGPWEIEFLDISHTALDWHWLEGLATFPRPKKGCEDQIFLFGSPLAESGDAIDYLKALGWQPVIEEE